MRTSCRGMWLDMRHWKGGGESGMAKKLHEDVGFFD
jgi:hypothetical protein